MFTTKKKKKLYKNCRTPYIFKVTQTATHMIEMLNTLSAKLHETLTHLIGISRLGWFFPVLIGKQL